jgi:hypothetical protein
MDITVLWLLLLHLRHLGRLRPQWLPLLDLRHLCRLVG